MNFVWSKLVLSIALFGFATSLHASTISGVVKDPSGAVIKGAKVEIRGKKHKDLRFFVRTLLGDEQGNLHFIQESRKADGSFYVVAADGAGCWQGRHDHGRIRGRQSGRVGRALDRWGL